MTRWLAPHADRLDACLSATPLKKASTADDVARAIEYLALDAATTTGQAIVLDGGRTM